MLVVALALVSCGPVRYPCEGFTQFLDARSSGYHITMPSGKRARVNEVLLDVEHRFREPHVVVTWIHMDDPYDSTYPLDVRAVEQDAHELARLLKEYASGAGWPNDYHPYIKITGVWGWSYSYDCEAAELYAPREYADMRELSDRFGTREFESIVQLAGGYSFLLERGYLEIRDQMAKPTLRWKRAFLAARSFSISLRGEFRERD